MNGSRNITDTKKRKKQLLFLLGVSILIPVFLINILGSHVLHMVPNEEYVKYSVPVSMAGAVASKETLDAEDIAVLEENHAFRKMAVLL